MKDRQVPPDLRDPRDRKVCKGSRAYRVCKARRATKGRQVPPDLRDPRARKVLRDSRAYRGCKARRVTKDRQVPPDLRDPRARKVRKDSRAYKVCRARRVTKGRQAPPDLRAPRDRKGLRDSRAYKVCKARRVTKGRQVPPDLRDPRALPDPSCRGLPWRMWRPPRTRKRWRTRSTNCLLRCVRRTSSKPDVAKGARQRRAPSRFLRFTTLKTSRKRISVGRGTIS